MIIHTTPQSGYLVTAVSVPLEIKALIDGQPSITLLTANSPGQYAFIAPSSQIELNQQDAIVTPNDAIAIAAHSNNLPLAAADSLGGVMIGNNVTLDDENRLVYNLQPASSTQLGGIKVGQNLSISTDGTLDVGNMVILANKKNTITGATEFTAPLKVADAVSDTDAVSKRTARKMMIADWHERQLACRADQLQFLNIAPFGVSLKSSATYPILFGWGEADGNVDAWYKYSLIMPIPRSAKINSIHQSYLALGYMNEHDSSRNMAPKLGEALWSSIYARRHAVLFPCWACPDNISRLQSCNTITRTDLTNPMIMGICIIPEDTAAIAWIKPESFQLNNYLMETKGLAGIFAISLNGKITHLFNHSCFPQGSTNPSYETNGYYGFAIGAKHPVSDYRLIPGLSSKAKAYWLYDPFDLKESDFTIKQAYMFDASKHETGARGGTVQSTWRSSGSLTPSTLYPSSDWLTVSVDANVVTISIAENTTGSPRQGVANLLADMNNITYSIVINQES